MIRFVLAVAVLAIAPTAALSENEPVTADPAAPPPTAATTVAPVTARANPDDKAVCKYQTPVGSRLGGKRLCMTQADWKAQEVDFRRQRDFAPPAGIAGAR